ncbi:MAG: PEGA domain-containing protein, partial [Rhodothermaceae bacterium]|nr:PEGA domain-containing protein [Rhodothermaceae bacterium]
LCLPSCTVQVGEEDMGKAPPALTMRLLAGEHQIRLNNPDFPPFLERLEVTGEGHDTLTVSLLETVGTLELKVIPWGEVFIDSTSYGVFPPSRPLRVWPGEHTLRVVHKELGEQELTFTIGKNEKLERTINLSETGIRRQ